MGHKQISVILDTSIFHDFNRISRVLYRLKEKKLIRVFISPMLLEETFRLMLHDKALSVAKSRLQFIFDISDDSWFEDVFAIFQTELKILPRRRDYQFLPTKNEQALRENMQNFLLGGKINEELIDDVVNEVQRNVDKGKTLRKVGVKMRQSVMQAVKKLGKKPGNVKETWESFNASNLNKWGIGLIRRKGCYRRTFQLSAVLVWATCKQKCPYFYDWVRGMLYISFYSMKYPNKQIDKNAQADIQHLVFLREVDAIVSEDNKFMRQAWQDIYEPFGKKYYNIADLEKLL